MHDTQCVGIAALYSSKLLDYHCSCTDIYFSDRNVQFKLSDYVDEEDEHMRNVLTPREYVTQMMITGFQRLHAAEGTQLGERSRLGVYPKKSRKDGVVRTWEARVTQSGIKVCCESAEVGVLQKTSVSMQ